MRIEDAALLARPCARGGFSDRRHERAAVSRACRHGDRVEPSEDPVLVPPVSSYDDVGMGQAFIGGLLSPSQRLGIYGLSIKYGRGFGRTSWLCNANK